MPLTAKGRKIMSAMEKTYGSKEQAERVFYASRNAHKLTGVDATTDTRAVVADFLARVTGDNGRFWTVVGEGGREEHGYAEHCERDEQPTLAGVRQAVRKYGAAPGWRPVIGPTGKVEAYAQHAPGESQDEQDQPLQALMDRLMKRLGGSRPSAKQVQDTFNELIDRHPKPPPPSDQTPVRIALDDGSAPANPAAEQLGRAATSHNAAARAYSKAAEVHTQAAARFSGTPSAAFPRGAIVSGVHAPKPRPAQGAAVPRPAQSIVTARNPREIALGRRQDREAAGTRMSPRFQQTPTHDVVRDWLRRRTHDEDGGGYTPKEAPGIRPEGRETVFGWMVSGDCAAARRSFRDAIRRGGTFDEAAGEMIETAQLVDPGKVYSDKEPDIDETKKSHDPGEVYGAGETGGFNADAILARYGAKRGQRTVSKSGIIRAGGG